MLWGPGAAPTPDERIFTIGPGALWDEPAVSTPRNGRLVTFGARRAISGVARDGPVLTSVPNRWRRAGGGGRAS